MRWIRTVCKNSCTVSRFDKLCATYLVIIGCGTVLAGEDQVHQSIVEEWNVRASSISSVRCRWRWEKFFPEGVQSFSDIKTGEHVLFPPDDTLTVRDAEFTARSDGSHRFYYKGPLICAQKRSFEKGWYLHVDSGVDSKTFFMRDLSARPTVGPVGFDRGPRPSQHLLSASTLAVRILYCWPELFSDDGRFDLDSYSVLPDREKLRGRECIVLRNRVSGHERIIMWVDQSFRYVPLCIRNLYRRDSGEWYVGWEWEMHFRRDEQRSQPIISQWEVRGVNRSGLLTQDSTAKCTSVEFNCEPPDSDFTFEFPSGTIVSEYSTDEYYILRKDGTKRHITWDEQNAHVPYRRLLETESGMGHLTEEALGEQQRKKYFAAALLAASAFGVFVFRMLNRKKGARR